MFAQACGQLPGKLLAATAPQFTGCAFRPPLQEGKEEKVYVITGDSLKSPIKNLFFLDRYAIMEAPLLVNLPEITQHAQQHNKKVNEVEV